MTNFQTMNEMWDAALNASQAGVQLDSRDGLCMESIGWHGKLTDISNNVVTDPRRKFCPAYASAELLWYLSGDDRVEPMLKYAPSYSRFAWQGGRANGAYGRRWGMGGQPGTRGEEWHSQVALASRILAANPESRQCVITCWDASDLVKAERGGCPDLPCTLSLQFLARNRRLNMVASMRSNDAWLGMPYDVYCFTAIQQIVADIAGLDYGTYVHQAGSMHLYRRDQNKLLNNAEVVPVPLSAKYDIIIARDVARAVDLFRAIGRWDEKWTPAQDPTGWLASKLDAAFDDRRNVLTDSVVMCAAKVMGADPVGLVRSKALLECWNRKQQGAKAC